MNEIYDNLYYFLPGYVQGLVKVLLSYPFDTVKVYMQKEIYSTTWDTFKNLWYRDARILYRGSILPIIIIPLERAFTLAYAEKISQGLSKDRKIGGYAGGAFIGAVSSLYYVPIQCITSNAVLTSKNNYKNIFKFMRTISIPKYRGFFPELMRSSAASSLFFGSYMWMRDTQFINMQHPSLVYGPIASIISWICIFPLDTIRTERQTTKMSYRQLINDKYKRLGIRAFYRGISPVIIRTIPSTALGMWTYEKIREMCLASK